MAKKPPTEGGKLSAAELDKLLTIPKWSAPNEDTGHVLEKGPDGEHVDFSYRYAQALHQAVPETSKEPEPGQAPGEDRLEDNDSASETSSEDLADNSDNASYAPSDDDDEDDDTETKGKGKGKVTAGKRKGRASTTDSTGSQPPRDGKRRSTAAQKSAAGSGKSKQKSAAGSSKSK